MKRTKQEELIAQVIGKAWRDPIFKQNLIDNPVMAIEEEIGTKLNIPKGKTLVVVDQSDANTAFINLPQNQENMELSNEELEAVAGGNNIPWKPWTPGDCFPS